MAKSQSSIYLLALLTVIGVPALWVETTLAQESVTEVEPVTVGDSEAVVDVIETAPAEISVLSEEQPATTGVDWQAQIEAVQITGIRVESTEAGLQVVIEADGELAAPTQSTSGNALVLEIPNATLAEALQEFEPAEGIALVQASALPGDIVQVAITGSDAVPVVNISAEATGLILGVTPGIAQVGADDDAIQLVVTGEEDGYAVPNATTGTRTDTPLRDTPQSVQVIPQEELEDQGVIGLNDALRNVSGVVTTGNDPRGASFAIRGFDRTTVLRDGFRLENSLGFSGFAELSNIEQIEVLKGPASILSGSLQPGGVVNLVTEQPLREPTYGLGLRLGNRGLIEPSLDFSGPLTEDGRLLYRINALVRREDYFRDFETDVTRSFFAPTISWAISDNTDLVVELEYRDDERPYETGIPTIGTRVASIPFERALTYPDVTTTSESTRVGYRFEHRFSENWKVRNAFYYNRFDTLTFTNIASTGFFNGVDTITLIPGTFTQSSDNVEIQTNVVGEFSTGSIQHTLLAGVDFARTRDLGSEVRFAGQLVTIPFVGTFPVPTITDTLNIFNPDYSSLTNFDPSTFNTLAAFEGQTEGWGFYVQDQIQLLDNLIQLAGLRYDTVNQASINTTLGTTTQDSSSSSAFTPRLGLVYQPSDEISLYTSYSRSFQPNTGVTSAGKLLDPEEGEQIELGVRAELLGGSLVANLALFNIDRTNVAISDILNPGALLAAGGQNIQGIELDVIGEILPGWNVVANYAYLDAEITASANAAAVGNRLRNIPEHNLNLWTNYTLQDGPLEGLSFGLGGSFVGDRFADENNTIVLESYFLTNAAIGYGRDNWQAALNFRNLFDLDYIEGSVSEGAANFPGAGFTVVGSFSITF
ncbi:MAG: TonB-dependent siderophore receptor [Leptolyngbyaceae cyanobacterium]